MANDPHKKTKKTTPAIPVVPAPAITLRLDTPQRRIVEDATTDIRGRAAVLAMAMRGAINTEDGGVPELFEWGVDVILKDIDRSTDAIMTAVGFLTTDDQIVGAAGGDPKLSELIHAVAAGGVR